MSASFAPSATMQRPWIREYPASVPPEIVPSSYQSIPSLLAPSLKRFAKRCAYRFMGKNFSFAQIDGASRDFAAYLGTLGLVKGDRVAIMMPNVPQYPIAVLGILRAGMIVVNVNPLYTPRELRHQLKDSGAQAILILENFASTLQAVIDDSPVKHTVVTGVGDTLGWPRRVLVNLVIRKLRRQIPEFDLPSAHAFNDALHLGQKAGWAEPHIDPDDAAVLQYTGGTTGLSKGAVLLHRNLVANILQSEAWYQPVLSAVPTNEQFTTVCALPLYHIFGFSSNMLLSLKIGGCNILIANPRDLTGVLKTLQAERFHSFPAVNTLFNSLVNHPDFDSVNWSHLRISVGGGMAVLRSTAERWFEKTGCPLCEGYGLSETSPVVTCNRVDITEFSGSIGLPVPSTEVQILADNGDILGVGQIGELAVRGPQVMAGYWQRPDETARAFTSQGFFMTGDMATIDEKGYVRIVDRKKDMILVSGFNVYPAEIEDLVSQLPGVLQCAAVGIPNEKSGECIKLVIVKQDSSLTEADVRTWCEGNLTAYKRPRVIEFREHLPLTTVGKVLRRELR